MEKKLYKDQNDKMVCGVCSGLAKYFGIDPTVVRLVMIALAPSGGSVLAYIFGAIVIPEKNAK